jgi:peptide/nickel transport system ATP-binding protein
MIAMALACEPRLLIADEPTTALDVTIQKQILELIDDLRHRLDMSVILVTHDLGVIAGRADRVAVMYAGKVVETTGTGRLYSNPRHPYTEALFDALPERATGKESRLYSIPGMPPDLTNPPPACRFAPRCRYAQDTCRASEPPLGGDTPGHRYACFFPVGMVEDAARAGVRTPRGPGAGESAAPAAPGAGRQAPAAAGQDGALLRVERLVKNFPVTAGAVLQRKIGEVSAVADVSFTARRGQTFGLVGESGCGKTTIGRLIVGLEKPSSGSIWFGDRDLSRLGSRDLRRQRRKVQLMFQDSYASMDPRMRVGPILREPLTIQHIGGRSERQRRVAQILDEVGLPAAAADRYPHEFSGGQRQRLGLARALILQPDMIVADEPVSALDVSIQAQILNLMRDLQREHDLTYLFISHDLSVVRYVSDSIGVMYLGKLVETGPANDVYLRPVHPYTKGLIDTIPVAEPEAERAKEHEGVKGELPSAIEPPSGCRFRTRCPFAQDICAAEEPPLRPFTAAGHLAACHFPLWGPEPGAAAAEAVSQERQQAAGAT